MYEAHDRAFKEWALVCEAMKGGTQILLIRKGGIREDGGVFRVSDPEFFLMPTYEHQDAALLQPQYVERLDRIEDAGHDPASVRIDAYAVVDTVVTADDEEALNGLCDEYVWNARYVRQRLDYNPYDPLYVILLRVYNLPEPVHVPMRPEYEGCKSWVTLDRPIPTAGAVPAHGDDEYGRRRADILARLRHGTMRG